MEDFAETKLIDPILPPGKYSSPVALFLVDINFCKKKTEKTCVKLFMFPFKSCISRPFFIILIIIELND